MGILDRIFGRKTETTPARTQEEIRAECAHVQIMGRWDSTEDMGKDDKVTMFICDSCQQTFTPEEGRRLRTQTADRLGAEKIERARERAERDGEATDR